MEEKQLTSKVVLPGVWRRACAALWARLGGWRTRPPRQLRLCENLALGDKRFLSVVEYGPRKFLVGGTGSSLAMLAVISPAGEEVGKDQATRGEGEVPLGELGRRRKIRKKVVEEQA